MLNPMPYFSKHLIQSYATLLVAVAKDPTALSLLVMLCFYPTDVEPINHVKSNLSKNIPNAASFPQTNHQNSTQNSEKSS